MHYLYQNFIHVQLLTRRQIMLCNTYTNDIAASNTFYELRSIFPFWVSFHPNIAVENAYIYAMFENYAKGIVHNHLFMQIK